MIHKQAVIVGGGPAGLAAALSLKKLGIHEILILEREKYLGGILNQCIHDGFGLQRFGKSLSGPEYAQLFIDEIEAENIEYMVETMVIDISADKELYAVSKKHGFIHIQAEAILLTMGCRERSRGALAIPGSRPSGIYTAGVAQSYINIHNIMVGRNIVILGSGDIGLIMARRFTLEGAKVKAVYEIKPYPSGLPRNIEQCLNDYDIPLYLSHTVVDIRGDKRLEAIVVAQCDENYNPIPNTEQTISCDTLILSVGLIPENELSLLAGVKLDRQSQGGIVDENFQTNIAGIFSAGNALHVHDLVDFVSAEAEASANSIAEYLFMGQLPICQLKIQADRNIAHILPHKISGTKDFLIYMRVSHPMNDINLVLKQGNKEILCKKIKKALPAEMLQIPVKANLLNELEDLEVFIV